MPIDVTEILQFAGIGFLLGIIGMVFKKLDIAKDVSELITLAGYVYMLIFIVQLIEILMTSLRNIFMLQKEWCAIDIVQIISLVIGCALVYLLLEEVNPKYAKGFSLVLLTFFFMVALQILSKMIGDLTAVFLNFNIEQQYVTIIIRLIGIVYYAEFVNFLLTEAKLGLSLIHI